MRVTVIGAGYVGLVTSACLADVGNEVLCVDVDPRKIEMLQSGNVPIFEPGLQQIVTRNIQENRLAFTTDIAQSVHHSTVQFIAVGTPADEDGSADLQYVLAAAQSIGQHMTCAKLIVNKSTSPVGTADKLHATIQHALAIRGVTLKFYVASNPEFLKEGAAIQDFMRPDRIVIGADSDYAMDILRTLYAPFQRNHDRLIGMDTRSAELTKYAANAMLATRISFMNELATLAEKLGADIEQIRRGIGADPRIGYHFLYAGCGYGGSCFPKDLQALRQTAHEVDVPMRVLDAVEETNTAQKSVLIHKLVQRFGQDLSGMHFALWGLAFKPNTDDMREAPSRTLLQALWSMGASVAAFDPVAMAETTRIFGQRPDLRLASSPMDALHGAQALLIVTEWTAFRSPDFVTMKSLLTHPVLFDGRNLYDPKRMRELGFEYFGIGRP